MIKTVSFAPPRAVSGATSKPSSKVAARSAAVQNAKARAQSSASSAPTPAAIVALAPGAGATVAASSVTSLFPKPSTPAEVSAAQAREQLRGDAPATKSRSRATSPAPTSAGRSPRRAAPSDLSLDLFSVDPAPVVETEVKAEPEAETKAGFKGQLEKPLRNGKTRLEASQNPAPAGEQAGPTPSSNQQNSPQPTQTGFKTKAEPKPKFAPAEIPVVETNAPQANAPQANAPVTPAKRAKRAKVPVNLAEQYGQSLSKRVENGVELPVVEDESPKKRLNRAERAARRELMNPDDDLRARLQRAQNAVPSAKTEKRPRGWRFDCGRCGRTSYFETPGALCSCGALAIKE